MTGSAWWAWARDGSIMHAWPLTEDQVRQAKAAGTEHDTVCGRTCEIGERPALRPHLDAERNHCPDCWAILNPRPAGVFLSSLVLPDIIPPADGRWRRSS